MGIVCSTLGNPPLSGFFAMILPTFFSGGFMAWQGIPFKFIGENYNSLVLAVNKIPDIVLKSDPDYTTVIITGVVSLVAGIIPAGIAVYTFVKNTRIIKDERVAQQSFLKAEREEQQRFLQEERASQVSSMEKDRETQRDIAEQNFNMEVLSANRQAWINNLRDLLSEYVTLSPDLLRAQNEFIIYYSSYENIVSNTKNRFAAHDVIEEQKQLESASVKLEVARENLNSKKEKERLLTAKIKLMLNPSESWYGEIIIIFNSVSIIYNSLNIGNKDSFFDKNIQMIDTIDNLVGLSQKLLKYEWERVKKGV